MIFLTAGTDTNRLATGLRRTTYSFRTLSPAEASRLRPLVLRIVTVQPGDTAESRARRLPYSDFKVERFEVLNGISRSNRLAPGQKLKMITAD